MDSFRKEYCSICSQYQGQNWRKAQAEIADGYSSGVFASRNIMENMAKQARKIPSEEREYLIESCKAERQQGCDNPLSICNPERIEAFLGIANRLAEEDERARRIHGMSPWDRFAALVMFGYFLDKTGDDYIEASRLFQEKYWSKYGWALKPG